MQGRLMQSSQIDWKASPSKLVVPWCFIAGFLPSSFADIGDVPIKPGRKPGLGTNCRFHLKSRAFPRWMHHAFPRECPYPHEVWTLCSSEIKWSVFLITFQFWFYDFSHVEMTMCKSDQVNHFVQIAVLSPFGLGDRIGPIGHIWESYDPGRLGQ